MVGNLVYDSKRVQSNKKHDCVSEGERSYYSPYKVEDTQCWITTLSRVKTNPVLSLTSYDLDDLLTEDTFPGLGKSCFFVTLHQPDVIFSTLEVAKKTGGK